MALRWIEGFENMGPVGTTGQDLQDVMAQKWDGLAIHNSCSLDTGRDGYGIGFQFHNSSGLSFTKTFVGRDTWIIGFGWRGSDWFTDNQYILYLNGPGGNPQIHIRREMNGELRVFTGGTDRGESTGANLGVLQWDYIEVRAYVHDTAGTVEIHVNGNTVLSLSGIDTDPYNEDTINAIKFNIDRTCMFDDIYICDITGTSHNDFLGPCRIEGLSLNSNDSPTQWSASGPSSHYSYLNEQLIDGDAGYVETDVSGSIEMFDWTALNPSFDVLGVQLNAFTRSLAAHGWDLYFRIDSNAVIEDLDSGDKYAAHSVYHVNYGISVTDPNTGIAWTPSGLNNATFGVKAV